MPTGVQFSSHHGDELTLWAVYERPGDGLVSPCLTGVQRVSLQHNAERLRTCSNEPNAVAADPRNQ